MAIIKSMSKFWTALLVSLCMAALAPGWASAHARHFGAPPSTMSSTPSVVAHATGHQFSETTVADPDDADCDGDRCAVGHCNHGCSCGCGMGACAGSCSVVFGQSLTITWSGSKQIIPPLVAQVPAATRGTCPLRP